MGGDIDAVANVSAGHVGSVFMAVVSGVGKKSVSVNKELSAAGGEHATWSVVEKCVLTSLTDLEYLVTP